MSIQAALDALETVKAARVAYRARLEALGYTHITFSEYGDGWSCWVHPDYLAVVQAEMKEHSGSLDKDYVQDRLGRFLPDGAIIEDVWMVCCYDTREGYFKPNAQTWDWD